MSAKQGQIRKLSNEKLFNFKITSLTPIALIYLVQ